MAKTPVRIILIKDNPDFDDAIDLPTTYRSKEYSDANAKLFWKAPDTNNTPKWVRNIFPADRELHDELTTRSIAAVLLIKHNERLFAVTFGYGRSLLKQELIESQFGLKVVLNRVKSDSLRSIDTKSLDGFLTHNREQTPILSPITSFGIDIEKDFIRAVTGKSSLPVLGETITGTDSFFASMEFTLAGCQPILNSLMEAYNDTKYKDSFEFVDNIKEVPKHQADTLDGQLVQKIIDNDLEHVWLAPPDIMDWENHGGFSFRKNDEKVYDDVGLNDYLADMVRDLSNLKITKLRGDKIYRWSADYSNHGDKWSIYKCLYAEIADGTKRYILSDGRWFEVDEDFVQKTNQYVANNLDDWTGTAFPNYNSSEMVKEDDGFRGEARYNRDVANEQGYVLTDAKTIVHGGAKSSIELCDLYKPGLYVHVKRYTRSSGLSHLFNQGKVSAELVSSDTDFRTKAIAKIQELGGTTTLTADRPDMQNTHVVFGVVSGSHGQLRLPFFSQVALKNAIHFLKDTLRVGKVSLVKIQATEEESD